MATITRARKRQSARTTYYQSFPRNPRPTSILVAVFWAVNNDYRALAINEKRNVVYPAKRAGLMAVAPANQLGYKINLEGTPSKCGFVLTEAGRKYFQNFIKPVIPDDFVSSSPVIPTRHVGVNVATEDLLK